MNDSDIHRLFLKAADSAGPASEKAKSVFSTLVSTTLSYRDRLKNDLGITVTVEDVQVALDWFLEFIQTRKTPETDNGVREDLFKLWVKRLGPF